MRRLRRLLGFGERRGVGLGAAALVSCAIAPYLLGNGVAPTQVALVDGVAWLASEVTGEVVRVNGESAQVDGAVSLGQPPDGELDVEQDGSLVVVQVGDELRAIDVGQLNWGAAGASEGRLYVGDGVVFSIDDDGVAVEHDPATLEERCRRRLDGAPRPAVVAGGRLVVPLDTGVVAAWDGCDGELAEVDVGRAGDRLAVSRVGDEVALLNLSAGEVRRMGSGTGDVSDPVDVDLPAGEVVVPPELPDGDLYVVAVRAGTLVSVDLGSGRTDSVSVAVPRNPVAGPVVSGGQVYLVDLGAAEIVQVDTAHMAVVERTPFEFEDPADVEVVVEADKVFVNDRGGADAVVIDGSDYTTVDKYDDEGRAEAPPEGAEPPAATPAAPPSVATTPTPPATQPPISLPPVTLPPVTLPPVVTTAPTTTTTVPPTTTTTRPTTTTTLPTTTTTVPPQVPGQIPSLEVSTGDGYASLSWQAAPSTTPVTYEVTVSPTPAGQGAGSTPGTSWQLTGLTNGTSYTVSVTPVNDVGPGPTTSTPVVPAGQPSLSDVEARYIEERFFHVFYTIDNGGRPVTSCTVTIAGGAQYSCDPAAAFAKVEVPAYDATYDFTIVVETDIGTATQTVQGTIPPEP